jgi:hypothetical protein
MRKYLLLFTLLALLLAACRVESNVTLDISEDGSATVGAEVGFDEEFKQLIEQSGANTEDIFGDLPSFGGGEVQTTERTDGDMSYYGVTSQVDDLSDFDMGSAQGDVFSSFSYTFDDASAKLDAVLSSADLGAAGGDLPIDPSTITDEIFSANIVVKMPGNVTESNADEVRSDGSLVWNIPFSGTKEITATSDFGSSKTNWVLFILIGVLIIGVIAAVVATIVSRRESQKAVEAAAASHQAPAATSATTRDQTDQAPAAMRELPEASPPPAVDAPALDEQAEAPGKGPEDPPAEETPAEQAWDSEGGATEEVERTIEVALEDDDQPDST